jgi:large subunit ribosomal protein L18
VGIVNQEKFIAAQRRRRRFRVRKRLAGTGDRPRLSVTRSHRNIACQLIDDRTGRTLVSAGTMDGELHQTVRYGGNRQAAEAVGKAIAERALAAGIQAARFDRGACRYHGRVAALADAARAAGLSL